MISEQSYYYYYCSSYLLAVQFSYKSFHSYDIMHFTFIHHIHTYCTGWGGESWTTFYGPAAVAIGRCERKD